MKNVCCVAVWALFFTISLADAQDDVSKRDVDRSRASSSKILHERVDNDSPGVAISVMQGKSSIFQECRGKSDVRNRQDIDSKTIFSAASVSKQFTALAILMLEAEGKISLDDRVRKYIPELAECATKVTLRQLADHTSGIRSHKQLFGMKGLNPSDSLTKEMVHRIIFAQQNLNFEPGNQFSYSNSGYALLAEIVERKSGMSFPVFVRKKILDPLDMRDSYFVVDFRVAPVKLASAYDFTGGGYSQIPSNDSIVGSTGLFTTLEDMCKWVVNFSNPKVGEPKLFRKMESLGVLNDGEPTEYGLGQFIGQHRGTKMIYHAGADAGFVAFVARFPERDLSVVLLGNSSSVPAQELALDIVNEFLPKPGREIGEPVELRKTVDLSLPELKEYVGTYFDSNKFIDRKIVIQDGKLTYVRPEQANRSTVLVPVSGNEFQMQGAEEVVVRFDGGENTRVMQIIVGGRAVEEYEELTPNPLTVSELRGLEGKYYSEELDIEYSIRLRDESLQVIMPIVGARNLVPVQSLGFRVPNSPINYLNFIESQDKSSIPRFEVSSERAKQVLFRKRK